jgi:hypothetical protein
VVRLLQLKAAAAAEGNSPVFILEGTKVVMVGDTHGQFHDVCRM